MSLNEAQGSTDQDHGGVVSGKKKRPAKLADDTETLGDDGLDLRVFDDCEVASTLRSLLHTQRGFPHLWM